MSTYDVAVVGSGAAGLVAACRAGDGGRSAVVLEKAELLGGTSAVSGGVLWMPANHLVGAQFPDSVDGALAYLAAATGGRVPEERLRWYVETSREAVRWLDEQTLVALAALPPVVDSAYVARYAIGGTPAGARRPGRRGVRQSPTWRSGATSTPTGWPRRSPSSTGTPRWAATRTSTAAKALGTCGGLVTDDDGRVLDRRGRPVPGLYAAGNVSAAVFDDAYPRWGATLGSAITRAYAAGRPLART